MNFQQIYTMPEKQWIDHVPLTVVQLAPTKQGKFQKFEQLITVKDSINDQRTMYIRTDYENGLMTPIDVNQILNFRIKWFQTKAGPGLTGYCEKSPQAATTASPASTSSPAPAYTPTPRSTLTPSAYTPPPSYTPPTQTPPAYVEPPVAGDDIQDRIAFAQAVNLGINLYVHEKCNMEEVKGHIVQFYALLSPQRLFPSWTIPAPQGAPPTEDTTDHSEDVSY